MKRNKSLSIYKTLYLLVLFCWVLPLLAAVLWFSSEQTRSTRLRVEETVFTTADHAMSELTRKLETALSDSRKASYDDQLRDIYTEYQKTQSFTTLYGPSTSYLSSQYGDNRLFDATLLFYKDAPDTPILSLRRGLRNQAAASRYFTTVGHDTLLSYATDLDTGTVFIYEGSTLYLVRNLVDSSYQPYATLIHAFHMNVLFEGIDTMLWAENVSFYIDGQQIPLLGELPPLAQPALAYDAKKDCFTVGIGATLENVPLSLEVMSCSDVWQAERRGYYATLIAVVLLSGFLFAVIARYIYRNISTPMRTLLQGTVRLEEGALGYQISPLPKGIEFYQITRRFNVLSRRLDEQFTLHLQEQQALHDAQIKSLQSQINPHFLNNTLEMINWQARIVGDEDVSEMISALSVMLNAAMARGGSATVTLREEYSYIEAYLLITTRRFGKRLQVHTEIDESVWDTIVPRLILQPIVENAVEHGVALRTSGEVHLCIYPKDDFLMIDVEHAGNISPKDRITIDHLLSWDGETDEERQSARIGIRNVQYRLKILYGEQSGLTIEEYEPGYVRNRIVLPLRFQSKQ